MQRNTQGRGPCDRVGWVCGLVQRGEERGTAHVACTGDVGRVVGTHSVFVDCHVILTSAFEMGISISGLLTRKLRPTPHSG